MTTSSFATLRSKIELDLRGRVAAPFTYRDRNVFDLVSSGIPEIDSCIGGLPRGAITEIYGPPCSGRTSLLVSALASRTTDGEVCALVDARDSFDPGTASAAGVELNQLLWVRCRNIDQALRATDLLIQGSGFGLVAIDLGDVAPKTVRQVPLNAWFRFRRAVEDSPTILMLVEQESNAKTCASLVLRLNAKPVRWSEAIETQRQDFSASHPINGFRQDTASAVPKSPENSEVLTPEAGYPFARLLRGYPVCAEVIRSRVQLPTDLYTEDRFSRSTSGKTEIFETAAIWNDFLDSSLGGRGFSPDVKVLRNVGFVAPEERLVPPPGLLRRPPFHS
jgi:recombination protein RecA